MSQILIKEEARARRVAETVKKSAPIDERTFRELVATNSEDDSSKPRGGDLAFFDRQTALHPRPLVEAAFALREVGETSPPVKSESGYHILRLTEKRPGSNRSFQDVKRQVRAQLAQELRTQKMDEWVAGMRSGLNVRVFDERLAGIRLTDAISSTQSALKVPQ